jgi:hypothetical protein
VRLSAANLAKACDEWSVSWEAGKDDLLIKAALFEKIHCTSTIAKSGLKR